MVSMQGRAVLAKYWLTRRKQVFADPDALRRSAESQEPESAQVPGWIRKRLDVAEHDVHGQRCYRLRPFHLTNSRHILYLHGGAYVHQVEYAHWRFLSRLIDTSGCTVTVPLYPLAPRYQYDDTLPMVIEAYESSVAAEQPRDQVIMGDSAGGGLSLLLAQRLKKQQRPQPHRIVMISPWLDVTVDDPSIRQLDPHDPFLGPRGLREAARMYAGDLDPHDPRVSPLYGDLEGLGRITVFIGTRDILLSDARRFREKSSRHGISLDYVEYPGMFHGWILQSIPEARSATEHVVSLLKSPH
ncbi:MAG: alpha/beta hydrolase fold domain-containing protein [Pseudonocardiaceae bacterium]|nr:alpha/beta hydrolase fold domain-containing protein [Pseudonocardiaceae bacterium]